MKNVTKLKCWEDLQKLGFEPIKYTFCGKTQAIGATNGKVTIEPHNYKNRPYHISGKYNKPVTKKCFIYDAIGRKQEVYRTDDFMNEFFNVGQILPTVLEMNN